MKKKPNFDRCLVYFVKRLIQIDSLRERHRRYDTEPTDAVTKLFFPIASEAYRLIRNFKMTKEVA